MTTSIVGRAAELRSLVDLCERAWTDGGQVAHVVGPEGIGKSALLAAVRRELSGWMVAIAYADDTETMVPFGVVDQLLRGLGHDRQRSGLGAPDAAAMGGAIIDAVEPPPGKSGVVLMVDDAHWADPLSVQAIAFAMRRLQPDPVAVVLTTRSGVPAVAAGALDRLLASPQTHTVQLAGLDLAASCELIASLGVDASDRGAVERLRVHSGGNPLHIRTLVSELGAAALPDAAHRPLPAPKAYGAIVTGRLAACGAQARAVVEAAAVLGQRSALAALAAVSGCEDVVAAVDEAVDRQLLVLSTESAAEVAFEHALVRASVYHALGLSARAALHRRAAREAGDRLTALRHLVAASAAADRELAGQIVDAARDEATAGRWAAAADLFAAAAGLESDPDEALRLRFDAVDCLLASGDVALAERRFRSLPAPAPASSRSAYVEARLLAASGRFDAALRPALRAARACPPEDTELGARIAALLAQLRINSFRPEAAICWARRALRLQDARALSPLGARGSLGFALVGAGRGEEALALTSGRSGEGPGELDRILLRGVVQMWRGDAGRARSDLAEAAAMRTGWIYGRVQSLQYLADAEYRLGLWDDAITHGQLAASLADDAEHSWLLPLAHSVASYPLSARGAWEAAQGHVDAARRAAGMHRAAQLFAAVAAARLAQARGDHRGVVDALGPIESARELSRIRSLGVNAWQPMLVVSLAACGEVDHARSALAALETAVREEGDGAVRLALARARAAVTLRGASGPDPTAVLSTALRAPDRDDQPLERALAELMLGGILRRARQRGPARELLVTARARLEALGAVPYLERCEREMSALGLARARGTHRDRDALTPQEVSVANLAASGLSNREIAGELVISVKTVEFHMSNVFAKLGVTSRARLARVWRTHEPETASAVGNHAAPALTGHRRTR